MPNPFIGKKDSIGFGKESTPGTAVAPTAWSRQLALTLDQKTTNSQNTTALGRVEGMDNSAVVEQWSEGSLNGIITDTSIGLLLLNIFGTDTAALHSGESTVYDNTFSVLQTGYPASLTFARTNPVVSRRYALGYQSDFEIDVKQADWAQFTSTIVARAAASSTETVAYNSTEGRFTSKHTNVYIASNVAGLGSATALQIKSLKLKISRKQDRFTPLGAIDPATFDPEDFNVSGTLVLRYTDTTIEALGIANTAQAMKIALINTDTTIGTAANPSLVLTMPQIRFDPITLDNNLTQTISQTVNFDAEFNSTAGYMLQAVLTNLQNGY